MTNSFLHPSFFELLLSYGIRYIRIPTESVIYPNVVNKETSIQETGETAIFICRIIDWCILQAIMHRVELINRVLHTFDIN